MLPKWWRLNVPCHLLIQPVFTIGFQIASVVGRIRGCGDPIYPGFFVRLDDPAVLSFIMSSIHGTGIFVNQDSC